MLADARLRPAIGVRFSSAARPPDLWQSVVKSGAECQPIYSQLFRGLPSLAMYISVHNL